MKQELSALVSRLTKISPLPEDDSLLTPELIDEYDALVEKIVSFRDPAVIPIILDTMVPYDPYKIYWAAMIAMENAFVIDGMVPGLLKAIRSDWIGSRVWGAYMLGRMRNPRNIPHLLPMLEDEETLVRAKAAMAMGMSVAELEPGEEPGLKGKAYLALKKLERTDLSREVQSSIALALESFG
ncbi:HEAT repeat domain-containing protein [Laceyella putida]|uniref:HEAT repeat domain-containing protein n=1 Tax=Laceyella putida TaxID=110101 RepID=A0ABW2RLN0_9BACL